MKKISLFGAAVLLMVTGCQSEKIEKTDAKPATPALRDQDEVAVAKGRALAEQYMACFVAAVEKNDFALLQSALPAKVAQREQRVHFADQMKWISEKLGVLKKSTYLDVFRKGAISEYVWKLTFEKGADGASTQVDLPYLVRTVCDASGEVKILMVGFVIR